MNRLELKLKDIRRSGKKALSVFLTAGYPTINATEALVPELEKSGVDFFEIGFPFSDPVADGPVIQRSSEIALKNGMNWDRLLETARRIRRKSQVPLVFMSYANTLYCRGWKRSIAELKAAGFDAAILPDMIPEESVKVSAEFKKAGLSLVHLCAPTSGGKRFGVIANRSSGFVYCVSVAGVTGARKALPVEDIKKFVASVRRSSKLPAMLGFGISKTEHLDAFAPAADGFVIGSAMIRALEGAKSAGAAVARAKALIGPFARRIEFIRKKSGPIKNKKKTR